MPYEATLNPLARDAAYFAQILEASALGLWEYDHVTGDSRWSPQMAALLGRSQEEGLASPEGWLGLVHPEDRSELRARLDTTALAPDNPLFEAQFRMSHQDGRWRWMQARGRVIERDPTSGQARRSAGTCRDISDWKTTELDLANRDQHLRLILDTITAVFWMADPTTRRMRYVSPAYERIWQRPVAELYANPESFLEAVHPEDRDRIQAELGRRLDGQPLDHEYRILRADGSVRWIWNRGFPVSDAEGRLTHYVGLARDISARKEAEHEIRRLNTELAGRANHCATELEASEARFRYAVEASSVGLWNWDLRRDTIAVSAAHAARLAMPPEGRPLRWEDLLCPEDRKSVIAAAKQQLQRDGRCEQELRLCFRDGGKRWVLSRGQVNEWGPDGEPLRAIGTHTDIDARRSAEARNRKLATILEASSDLIATATPEGQVDYINQAGRTLLGLEPLQSLEPSRVEDYHPEDTRRRLSEESLPMALAQGQWLGDSALLRRDGSEALVSQLILAPRDPVTGQVEFLATICHDLSERHAAEERLRQLQEELELILDNVPALIFYKDTANHILRVNAAVARSLGLPKALIEGRHSSECYPQDAERYYQDDLAVIRAGEPRLGIEEPYRLPSGERRWIRTDKVPLKDASGQVTRILVMSSDISAHKEAEKALRLSQNDLNRAQAVARVGSWRLDLHSNRLTWSAEAHRIFGISEDVPVTYETFMGVVHPEDRDLVDRSWRASLLGEPYDIEHRLIVDGQLKWVREKAELEYDEEGVLLGGFGTTQEITERKAVEQTLRDADRHKDEFLAILGHELLTPLAPIRSAADILRLAGGDETTRERARAVIERQVDHLKRLVDDLLDLSRISKGTIPLRPERLAVAEVVERAVETSRPLIDARRHELSLRLPPDALYVTGDPIRLAQVVSNLLNNAAKYTEPGGQIQLTVAREENEAVISVKDSGKGLPAELLEHIFTMFVRGQHTRDNADSGLGIGLSLSRQLVDLHGGTITARSAGDEQGSEFIVRLPLSPPPVAAPAPLTAQKPGSASRHRILVADDDRDIADSLSLLLDLLGQEVRIAHDGLEAVELAAAFQPDLILLDLGMPRLDGYDACRRLRQVLRERDTTIVALTGLGQARHKAATSAAGFDQHLVKPISLPQLQSLLAALPEGVRP
ncbi:PAS domain-containing protein [Thiocystis violacea]|uniref:PAS domain-containing protein n=1 Tax=Thiocystis violacea TaxID=13725 RepID=UPI001907D7D1|nr:PAS domain-containing protein [Thiocystis violacea]MBK1716367.1 hypothetical protein [Thiocystis violacea]